MESENQTEKGKTYYEFSLYPHAYCFARIPADEPIKILDITQAEADSLDAPVCCSQGKDLWRLRSSQPGFFEIGWSLFLFWSQRRCQWFAFRVVHILVDLMYDETYYSYANELNSFARRKLLDAFRKPTTEVFIQRVDRMSPEELSKDETL
ncbi:MAG: hypothetical protein ABSB25_10015 [Sedimentisphaerales bacterium]|jgi:hypothetical protein